MTKLTMPQQFLQKKHTQSEAAPGTVHGTFVILVNC